MDQFFGEPISGFGLQGMKAYMAGIAERNVPVYLRTYEEDVEPDVAALNEAYAMLAAGNDGHCEKVSSPGLHHKFYVDDTAEKLAEFFTDVGPSDLS